MKGWEWLHSLDSERPCWTVFPIGCPESHSRFWSNQLGAGLSACHTLTNLLFIFRQDVCVPPPSVSSISRGRCEGAAPPRARGPHAVITSFWRGAAKQLICFFMTGPGKGDKEESLLNCCSSFFLQHTKTACIAISCHIQKIRTLNGSKLLFWKSARRMEGQIWAIWEWCCLGWGEIIWIPCRREALFLFWQGKESFLLQAELTFRTLWQISPRVIEFVAPRLPLSLQIYFRLNVGPTWD